MRILGGILRGATPSLAIAAGVLLIGCGSSAADVSDSDGGTSGDAPDDSATGTLGDPCGKSGALACNGKGQKLQLLCQDGKWVANGTCAGQQVCDPRPGPTQGSCQDPAPGCGNKTPGTAYCDGATRHVCSDDLLTETSATCKSAAYCEAGLADKCAICLDGESTCDGPALKVCAPDHQSFATKDTCATSALCVPGETTCHAPACAIGDEQCSGDKLQTCNDGRTGWNDVKTCGSGLCDAASKSCLDCKSGSKQCSGSTPQTCDSTGHWASGTPCSGSTPVCTGGTCGAGVCSSGDYRCTGDALETCNSTSTGWDPVTTCGAGLCDAAAKSCDECTVGSLSCSGTTPETCPAGKWVLGTTCSGSTPTCSAGKCVSGFTGATGASWTVLTSTTMVVEGWSDYSPAGSSFFFGLSNGGSWFLRHDDASDAWTTKSSPGSGINWAGMAWIGGDLYTIQNGFVYDYAIATDTWSKFGSGIPACDYSQTTHDDSGNIYAVLTDTTNRIVQVDTSTHAVHYFSFPTGVASNLQPHTTWDPTTKSIYFVPNFQLPGLYSLDPATGTVASRKPIPDAFMNNAFCGDRSGHIYAAGGISMCAAADSKSMWQYDTATDTWKRIPDLPFNHGCSGACTVTDDGWLYVTDGDTYKVARIPLL